MNKVKDMRSFWEWMTGDLVDNIFTDGPPLEGGYIANITKKNHALPSTFANNGSPLSYFSEDSFVPSAHCAEKLCVFSSRAR